VKYKLVAFDLDGTLLDNDKHIVGDNLTALLEAHERGMYIVPATGRTWPGMPQELKALSFIRYCITVNGACVYDREEDRVLHKAEIDSKRALEIMEYMDSVDALYDCYQDNRGLMSRGFYEKLPEYTTDPAVLRHVMRLRNPVDDLKTLLRENGRSVQKIQMHFKDPQLRLRQLKIMPGILPDMAVTSSIYNNIEINCLAANKGDALIKLCELLGIPPEESISFGDGSNDISMLRAAGVGVAMGNAEDFVKAAADLVTDSNVDAGLAKALRKLMEE